MIRFFEILNSNNGIKLDNSNDNNITDNKAYYNQRYGICIEKSNDNIITDNKAFYNGWYGICIEKSNDNTITDNNASYNSGYGISISDGPGNKIKGNNASNNEYGFGIIKSKGNIVTGNNASYNNHSGIHLSRGSGNKIRDNNASNNKHGFLIEESMEDIVTNNSAIHNYYGIVLYRSRNSIIANNTLRQNQVNGLFLEDSPNNNITSNFAGNNTGCGIAFINSMNNNLTNNSAFNNTGGIALRDSSHNKISGNIINYNSIGLYLSGSNHNELKEDYIYNNEVGVALNSSENNTINHDLTQNNKYDKLINNDTILDRCIWEESILSEDIDQYLQSHRMSRSSSTPEIEKSKSPTPPETSVPTTKKDKGHGVPYVPPSGVAASPPTTEDYQQLAEEAAGRIVWNPAQNMSKGEGYWIDARIAAKNTTKLVEDLIGKGETQFREIDVAIGISYKVILEGDQFNISTRTPDLQRLGEDPAEWLWYVTPLKEGNHTLILYVFVQAGEPPHNVEYKEKLVWPVEVKVIEPPPTPLIERGKKILMGHLEFIIGTLILGSGLMGWIISQIRSRKKRTDTSKKVVDQSEAPSAAKPPGSWQR